MPEELRRDRLVASKPGLVRLAISSLLGLVALVLVSASPEAVDLVRNAEQLAPQRTDPALWVGWLGLALAILLAGFWVARSLTALATERSRASARSADQFERLLPLLERVAGALEQSPAPARLAPDPAAAMAEPAHRPMESKADEIRAALRELRWKDAQSLAEAQLADWPDSAEARSLTEEVEQARESIARDLRARIDASRAANDPESVLEYRDQLFPLLALDNRRELDRDLIQWFLPLLMRRLRTGSVQAEVVTLASRLVEAFPETPEGASLRASLPVLRRSAGLCPRCAQPYRGIDEACPECLAPAPEPTILPLRDEAEEAESEGEGEDDAETQAVEAKDKSEDEADPEAAPNSPAEEDPFVREPD